MLEGQSVFYFQDYGRVHIMLAELLKERGMTRGRLACLSHSTYSAVNRLYHGKTKRLDGYMLARICRVLDCELSDILRYEENQNHA